MGLGPEHSHRRTASRGSRCRRCSGRSVRSELGQNTTLSQFTNADGARCGPFGDSDEHDTNQRKNRTNIPSVVHDVTFRAVADLPFPPKAPKERTQWSEEQLNVIRPFEDVGVRVVGFLVAIKPQTGGSGESTNCHMTRAPEPEGHRARVETAGDGESDSVVVETTARLRRLHARGR